MFGHLGVEVVHEHAHGGFLRPSLTGELVAARGVYWGVGGALWLGSDGHNRRMVVGRGVEFQVANIFTMEDTETPRKT